MALQYSRAEPPVARALASRGLKDAAPPDVRGSSAVVHWIGDAFSISCCTMSPMAHDAAPTRDPPSLFRPPRLAAQGASAYGTIVPLTPDSLMVVVDTSIVLAVLLNEPERDAILTRTRGKRVLVAPSLPWEVGNALVALVRRGRADLASIVRVWRAFEKIPLSFAESSIPASLRLAAESALYAYDAYVIEAARAAGTPLMTLDKKQRSVAVERGIDILEVT